MTGKTMNEQLNAMDRLARPEWAMAALSANASNFWESQDKLLDNMQSLANGWFERRHAGTHAALEAAERICKAGNPADVMREYQAWATGASQRLMADGLACQQQMLSLLGAMRPPVMNLEAAKASAQDAAKAFEQSFTSRERGESEQPRSQSRAA